MSEYTSNDIRHEIADGHDLPIDAVDYIGEPATRADGYAAGLVLDTSVEPPRVISFLAEGGSPLVTVAYPSEVVDRIGDGDFKRGCLRLARAVFSADSEILMSNDQYPFASENGD